MSEGPSWLTDPEYNADPPDSDWFRGYPDPTYPVPVEECDHPPEEIMTTENGLVECHQCGLAVGKKPIVSDAYHGRRRPGGLVASGGEGLVRGIRWGGADQADALRLVAMSGVVSPERFRQEFDGATIVDAIPLRFRAPAQPLIDPSWFSTPPPPQSFVQCTQEHPCDGSQTDLHILLWGECFQRRPSNPLVEITARFERALREAWQLLMDWMATPDVQAILQAVSIDAELAALPRNTRRIIDGRKMRIAGRPGNRHWREVAPARYKGAKR